MKKIKLTTYILLALTAPKVIAQNWAPSYQPQEAQRAFNSCPQKNLMFTVLNENKVDTRYAGADVRVPVTSTPFCQESINFPSYIPLMPGQSVERQILFRNPSSQSIQIDFTGGYVCSTGDNPSAQEINCRNTTARSFNVSVISGRWNSVRRLFDGFDFVAFRVSLSAGESAVVNFRFTAPVCPLNYCQDSPSGKPLVFRYSLVQYFGGVSYNTAEQREFYQHFNPLPNINIITPSVPTASASPRPTPRPTPTASPVSTVNPSDLPPPPRFVFPIPPSACVNPALITLQIEQFIPFNNWEVQYRTGSTRALTASADWRTPIIHSNRRELIMQIPEQVFSTGSTFVQARFRNLFGWGQPSEIILACVQPTQNNLTLTQQNCGNRTVATFSLFPHYDVTEYRLSTTGNFQGPWLRLPNVFSTTRTLDISEYPINQNIEIQLRVLLPSGTYTAERVFTLCVAEDIPQASISMLPTSCRQLGNTMTFLVAPYNFQKTHVGYPVNNQHTSLEVLWRIPQGTAQTARILSQPNGMGPYQVTISGLPPNIRTTGIIIQARWISGRIPGPLSTAIECAGEPETVVINSLTVPSCNRSNGTGSFVINQTGTAPPQSHIVVEASGFPDNSGAWQLVNVLVSPSMSGGTVNFLLPFSLNSSSVFVRAYWRGPNGRQISNTSSPVLICNAPAQACFPSSSVSQFNAESRTVSFNVPPCPDARSIRIEVATDPFFSKMIPQGIITKDNINLSTGRIFTESIPVNNGVQYYVRISASRNASFTPQSVFATTTSTFLVRFTEPNFIPTPTVSVDCERGSLTASYSAALTNGLSLVVYFRQTNRGVENFRILRTYPLTGAPAGSSQTFNLNLSPVQLSSNYEIYAVTRSGSGTESQSSNVIYCSNNWLNEATRPPHIQNVSCGGINDSSFRPINYSVNFITSLPNQAIWQSEYRLPNSSEWRTLPDVTISNRSQLQLISQRIPMVETLSGTILLRGRILNANARNQATVYSNQVEICGGIGSLPVPELLSVACNLHPNGNTSVRVVVRGNRKLPYATKVEIFSRWTNTSNDASNSGQWAKIYESQLSAADNDSYLIFTQINPSGATEFRARYAAPGITSGWSNSLACLDNPHAQNITISRVLNNCGINIITIERPSSPLIRPSSTFLVQIRMVSDNVQNENTWHTISSYRFDTGIFLPLQFAHPSPAEAQDRINDGKPASERVDFTSGYEIRVNLIEPNLPTVSSNILVCR